MKQNKMKLFILSATATLFLSGCDLIDYINVADDVKAREEQKALEKEALLKEANGGSSLKDNDVSEPLKDFTFKDNENTDDTLDKSESNSDKESSVEIDQDDKEDNSSDFSDIFEATWVASSDGDTITIRKEDKTTEKVRLLLVDTPELSGTDNGKPQLYGHQASRYVKALQKENKNITVKVGNPTHDKYGRLLAYVYLSDGEMLNEHLVRMGFARVAYAFPPNTQYLDRLLNLQEQAENEKLLIWSVDGFVTDKGFDMDVVTNEHYSKSVEQTKDLLR